MTLEKKTAADKLTDAQLNAIGELISGSTVAAAAVAAAVDRRTIFRWQRQALFEAALNQARQMVWQQNVDYAASLRRQALDVLAEFLAGDDSALRYRAAAMIARTTPADRPEGETDSVVIESDQNRRRALSEVAASMSRSDAAHLAAVEKHGLAAIKSPRSDPSDLAKNQAEIDEFMASPPPARR